MGEGLETTDCRIWFADQCGYLRRKRLRDIPDCQLHGIYQEKNMQTAYVALCALKDRLTTVRPPAAERPSDDCQTADAERQKIAHFVRCQTDIVSNAESVFQRSGRTVKRSDNEVVVQRSAHNS